MTRDSRPERYVVDASVALEFIWPGPHTDAAVRFFTAVHRGWAQLLAPECWLTECAHGCWKRVQRQAATAEEALAAFATIAALPVARLATGEVTDVVMGIALQNRVSTYDALYVATAQFAGVPLVTGDGRLVQMLKEAGWEGRVFHISQW